MGREQASRALDRYELAHAAEQTLRVAVRRPAGPAADPAARAVRRHAAAARRADRQPRPGVGRGAGGGAGGLRRHGRRGDPRPVVRPRLRPVPGLRRRRRRSTSRTSRSGTRAGSSGPARASAGASAGRLPVLGTGGFPCAGLRLGFRTDTRPSSGDPPWPSSCPSSALPRSPSSPPCVAGAAALAAPRPALPPHRRAGDGRRRRRAALAARAGHRRELLLRHGRPVRERRHGQRHRRPRRRPAGVGLRPDEARASTTAATSRGCSTGSTTSRAWAPTSIWLTPSFKNKAVQLEDGPSAGYHGYWITDFTQIDPHLGTNADLKDAGRRGARARDEGLLRHHHQPHRRRDRLPTEGAAQAVRVARTPRPTATAAGDGRSTTATTPATNTLPGARRRPRRSRYTPVLDPAEQNLKVPAWLNDVTLYHNRGDTTFVGENSQYGDFFGLDDLFTEHPRVVDGHDRHLRDVDRRTSASTASASTP